MNILLLQGPMGPFFSWLRRELEEDGHTVFKINFNGGDSCFYRGPRAYAYRGHPDEWGQYIENFMKKNNIQVVFAYGDCRFYHREAKTRVKALGLRIFFYEEGYLRPNYITLEEDGVNGNSPICKMSEIPEIPEIPASKQEVQNIQFEFWFRVIYASVYYLAGHITRKRFPDYQHHRSFNPYKEACCWLRSGIVKITSFIPDKIRFRLFLKRYPEKFYFIPLQVRDDMQIKYHSPYESISDFIIEVLESFKKNAPVGTALLFKHHPMDRGYGSYRKLINRNAKRLGIVDRVAYVFEARNPTILRSCLGVVAINSTMGLSAMVHGKKIYVAGVSVYNRKNLTIGGKLNDFWMVAKSPDKDVFWSFHRLLLSTTQRNLSFYLHNSKILPSFDDEYVAVPTYSIVG